MKTVDVKTSYSVYTGCYLKVGRYVYGNSMALSIWNYQDGCIAVVTVCLPDYQLGENEAFVDENNRPWAVEFLEKHGFAKKTGRIGRSGYCEYPVMKFDRNKMKEYEVEE